jgi:hypothetical protein
MKIEKHTYMIFKCSIFSSTLSLGFRYQIPSVFSLTGRNYVPCSLYVKRRDTSVGIATRQRSELPRSGVRLPVAEEIVAFFVITKPSLGFILLYNVNGICFPVVKEGWK